jgi:hypothetical protein
MNKECDIFFPTTLFEGWGRWGKSVKHQAKIPTPTTPSRGVGGGGETGRVL